MKTNKHLMLTILATVLLISTVNASLISNYATLTGTCTVDEPVIEPPELSTISFSRINEITDTAEMNYYEEGNEFYYELNSTDLKKSHLFYTLVYFNNNGTSPCVIVNNTIAVDSNGSVSMFESVNLNESLENAHFELYRSLGTPSSYFIGNSPVNYTDTDI